MTRGRAGGSGDLRGEWLGGVNRMLGGALMNRILTDEAMTRLLGDDVARVLVEWLADAADRIPDGPEETVAAKVEALRQRGRVLSRFVRLWCYEADHAAATQFAATERLTSALPSGWADPYRLMQKLVAHEAVRRAA